MSTEDDDLLPLDSKQFPRFASIATFMRSKHRESPQGLDIALIGVPFDLGSSSRAGSRHGPSQIRDMSRLYRQVHFTTKIAPFEVCRIADLGDAPLNPLDLMASLDMIHEFFARVVDAGTLPLSAGGDHTITLPILRAVASKGPIGVLQIDAHPDTNDEVFGHRYNNATPFRRAIEEELIDPKRYIIVGLRALYHANDLDWVEAQGATIVTIDDFCEMGIPRVTEKIRAVLGDRAAYLTFDIDGLDPAHAPGTGALEPGGLTTREALGILRGLFGLNFVGADLTEVAPPLDPSGRTAIIAANMMFEELCLLADAVVRRKSGSA